MQLPIKLEAQFWGNVLRKISSHTMSKGHEQYLLAIDPNVTEDCSNILTGTIELPCQHSMQKMLVNNRSLEDSDIHMHWWLHQPPPPPDAYQGENLHHIVDLLATRYKVMNEYQQAMLRNTLEVLDSSHVFSMNNPVVARNTWAAIGFAKPFVNKAQSFAF